MYAEENIRHILMQCHSIGVERASMYHRLYSTDPFIKEFMERMSQQMYIWLLAGNIEGQDTGNL